ncbi:hypothetical protein QFC24_006916 [Naganishia onofrii]|uniref:Uncharacterized protein n=1 Tax=Naganishia onofrii TaxID=1851511 RepID=A0ACC2WVD9_9TREE|nr:hypothetical protein QFC24_006916 [Naganishia onofrii]
MSSSSHQSDISCQKSLQPADMRHSAQLRSDDVQASRPISPPTVAANYMPSMLQSDLRASLAQPLIPATGPVLGVSGNSSRSELDFGMGKTSAKDMILQWLGARENM